MSRMTGSEGEQVLDDRERQSSRSPQSDEDLADPPEVRIMISACFETNILFSVSRVMMFVMVHCMQL